MGTCIESQNSENSIPIDRGVDEIGFIYPRPELDRQRAGLNSRTDSDVEENLSNFDKNPKMYQNKFLISSIDPGVNQQVSDLFPESDLRYSYSNYFA